MLSPYHVSFVAIAVLSLDTTVYAQSIQQLPSCWSNCVTGNSQQCTSKPNSRLNCLCNLASTSTLIPDTLTCIRTSCSLSSPLSDFVSILESACADTNSPISSTSVPRSLDRGDDSNDITATVIGYMTNSAGETQSYAFPAILSGGSVEYGSPTQISGGGGGSESAARTTTVVSRVTSVASRSTAHPAASSSGVILLSGTATMSDSALPSTSPATTLVSTSLATVGAASSSSSAASSSTSASSRSSNSGSDGSLNDVGNEAARSRAGSLLGLTISLLAGVAWF